MAQSFRNILDPFSIEFSGSYENTVLMKIPVMNVARNLPECSNTDTKHENCS